MGQLTRLQTAAGDTDAYLATASQAPAPPILLLHPWWGLNQAIRDLADRLAGDGFTVMAPDLFNGTVLTTPADAEAHVKSLTPTDGERMTARVQAMLDHLLANPDARGDRAAIIGLSFGAMEATQLAEARPEEVAALVCVYSGIFEAPSGIPYLGHFAEHDDFDDSSQVPDFAKTLGEGSAAYVYPGTKHWFLEPDRPEYDADAAELAYRRTVDFLRANLA
jgi:carboxymethylenebutenolidase